MGDDERATLETLDAYRAVFSNSIAEHDGRVVSHCADERFHGLVPAAHEVWFELRDDPFSRP